MFSAIPVNRLMSSQFYYKGEIEEGPGEDDDEPGDIDVNDEEEDSC